MELLKLLLRQLTSTELPRHLLRPSTAHHHSPRRDPLHHKSPSTDPHPHRRDHPSTSQGPSHLKSRCTNQPRNLNTDHPHQSPSTNQGQPHPSLHISLSPQSLLTSQSPSNISLHLRSPHTSHPHRHPSRPTTHNLLSRPTTLAPWLSLTTQHHPMSSQPNLTTRGHKPSQICQRSP